MEIKSLPPEVLSVINKINKKHGEDTVILGSQLDYTELPRIPSGSLSLDVALGGGWPANQWNEVIGHECLCPGTKILCSDLVWRNIEELSIDDEIIGFGEELENGKGSTSNFERARVTHLGGKILPVYEMKTPLGTTYASGGHLWLVTNRSSRREWTRTDELQGSDKISAFEPAWEENNRLLSITYVGNREVVTIGTSTRTLIANGLLSHNSEGKTALLMKTVAANQARDKNWICVWVAAEHFVKSWARSLGCDTQRIIVVDTNIMEDAYQAVIEFLDSRSVDGVVIDSLPALVPSEENEKLIEDFTMGLGARITGKFFRKVGKAGKRSMTTPDRLTTGWVVNQWREKLGIQFGDPRTTPGGRQKNFHYFTRVIVNKDDWIKDGDTIVGQVIKAEIRKNKTGPPRKIANFDFYFDDSPPFHTGDIDHTKEIISLAQLFGLIARSSGERGLYLYKDWKWRGRNDMIDEIRQDIDLQKMLTNEVMGKSSNKDVATNKRKISKRSGEKPSRGTRRKIVRRDSL